MKQIKERFFLTQCDRLTNEAIKFGKLWFRPATAHQDGVLSSHKIVNHGCAKKQLQLTGVGGVRDGNKSFLLGNAFKGFELNSGIERQMTFRRFAKTAHEKPCLSRDWLVQLWLVDKKEKSHRIKRTRRVIPHVHSGDSVVGNQSLSQLPFMRWLPGASVGEAKSDIHEKPLLEQPPLTQSATGHFMPTSPEEVKIAPLLARANLLITRDIEWANLMLGFEQGNFCSEQNTGELDVKVYYKTRESKNEGLDFGIEKLDSAICIETEKTVRTSSPRVFSVSFCGKTAIPSCLRVDYAEENRYAIVDVGYPQSVCNLYPSLKNFEPVGFIREQSNVIMRQLLRTRRPFIASITDAMGNEIFRVRRPPWLINSTIYAEIDGKEIGVVHRRWHLWRRIYDLCLGKNQFAVVENPGFWNWTFTLKDQHGNVLAEIDRDWRGIGFELFTDAGQYVIRFGHADPSAKTGLAREVQELDINRPLTLSERAVAVALAVSLDNDYFSRHGGWGIPFIPINSE